MKVLLVTNMRPSPQKPYSGIFVVNQFNRLKEIENIDVSMFSMERSFTSSFGSIVKYVRAFISFTPHFTKKYDIVHLHYFFPFIILVHLYKLLRPKTRIVVTFHGSDMNERINERNRFVFQRFSTSIDYVISVGQDLADMVYAKLGLTTDQILSAGIEDRVFKFEPGSNKRYHFTFASSFVPRKGIDIYLEAIRRLNRKDISFCFIGSGVYEQEIHNLADEFDIEVKLNLKQSEMCQVFNESYYHVLPSRFEPFGLVVTESMFCGTPSIVSNVGGIKDQVNNGHNGFILKELSPECLADQMKGCLQLIENGGYQHYHQIALDSNKFHSLTNVIRETKKIYADLL